MAKVKVLAPHANEYGEAHEKKKGDTYEAPDLVAQSLEANGYVEWTDKPKQETKA